MNAPETVFEDKEPTESLAIVATSREIVIASQEGLTFANNTLLSIKGLRRRIDDEFNPGIAQAFTHHRFLVAQKKKFADPLDEAERTIKPKIAAYLVEEDRKRFEAQRAAQRAKEAVEKEANDAADVTHELIKNGELDEADQLVEMTAEKIEAIQSAAPAIPEKAVAEGASLRTNWDFEIENESLIPRQYLMPDMVKIRGYVRAMKDQGAIAGIRIFSTKTIASKGR